MKREFVKRCIASLLAVVTLSGAFAPLTVYAEDTYNKQDIELDDTPNTGHFKNAQLPENISFTEDVQVAEVHATPVYRAPLFHYMSQAVSSSTKIPAELEPYLDPDFEITEKDEATNTLTFKPGSLLPETGLYYKGQVYVSPTITSMYTSGGDYYKARQILDVSTSNAWEDEDFLATFGNGSGGAPDLDETNIFAYTLLALDLLYHLDSIDVTTVQNVLGPAFDKDVVNTFSSSEVRDLHKILEYFGLTQDYGTPNIYKQTDASGNIKFYAEDIVNTDTIYDFKGYSDFARGTYRDFMFAHNMLGTLSKTAPNNDPDTIQKELYAKVTIYKCLITYINIYSSIDTVTEEVGTLIRDYYDTYRPALPWLEVIYTRNPGSYADKSFEQAVRDLNLSDDVTLADIAWDVIKDFFGSLLSGFQDLVTGKGVTPIDRLFYKKLSAEAITYIDRDEILNNELEDWTVTTQLAEDIDYQHRIEHVASNEDLFYDENRVDEEKTEENSQGFISTALQGVNPNLIPGNPDAGYAGLSDVSLSAYIRAGIYVSNYLMPMVDNMSGTKVLDELVPRFSDDFDVSDPTFTEFNTRYGGLRKALLIDTSGTSAMDYYNNAERALSYKVCTLRDLLECGDSDVTLYLDTRFYNADIAIDQGTRKLLSHLNDSIAVTDKLRILMSTYYALNNQTSSQDYAVQEFIKEFGRQPKVTAGNVTITELLNSAREGLEAYDNFRLAEFCQDKDTIEELIPMLETAKANSNNVLLDNTLLKTGGYTTYSMDALDLLGGTAYSGYISGTDRSRGYTNFDSIVLSSEEIDRYLLGDYSFDIEIADEVSHETIVQEYQASADLGAMKQFAFVSLLYRAPDYFILDNLVANQNPVFMASTSLCQLPSITTTEGENLSVKWYRNSLLNWMLLKNLKANVQIDSTYTTDLDCPVYMDIYGNIVAESGTVIIPAASNATLFPASYASECISWALCQSYGKIYKVPLTLEGAGTVLDKMFYPDLNSGYWELLSVSFNEESVEVADEGLQEITLAFLQKLVPKSTVYGSKVNWMAYVQIINEVMRGTEIYNLDKDKESLYTFDSTELSKLVAATKLESIVDALQGVMQNTLLSIPNFATMDGFDYYVSLAFKAMILLTILSCIVLVYRDGAAGDLTFRTFWKVLLSAVLTFSVVVVVPAVFQLTYYSANKIVLEKDAFRILMMNEEKRAVGSEVGITDTTPYTNDGEFKIQLEWVDVPWWQQIENVMFGDSVRVVTDAKAEAYKGTLIQGNNDVVYENDGVFVSTNSLFDSVGIDYTWSPNANGDYGLYLTKTSSDMSASYFSPYYVFLNTLVANVNEFNAGREGSTISGSNYYEKMVAGQFRKTVGLSWRYFTSNAFMAEDSDLMRLGQVYRADEKSQFSTDTLIDYVIDLELPTYTELQRVEKTDDDGNTYYEQEEVEVTDWYKRAIHAVETTDSEKLTPMFKAVSTDYRTALKRWDLNLREEQTFARNLLYTAEDIEGFEHCLWWNKSAILDIDRRIEAMDDYAREFVASNRDLLTRVTDETFLKVMALYMSVKYNQLFGIQTANALEIYNLNTEDLIRLCMVTDEEAAMSTTQSFARFVYTYGGQPTLYVTALLLLFMAFSSFVKPICVIIVFCSVFLSIWVFRVLLQKPSANLIGYAATVGLLCLTNLTHAAVLKASINLPNTGLNPFACLCIVLALQIIYMCMLVYVTFVSLKDWYNLGFLEYRKEYLAAKNMVKQHSDPSYLDGRAPHYENGEDYYNVLRDRHRRRSALDTTLGFDTVNTSSYSDITNDSAW